DTPAVLAGRRRQRAAGGGRAGMALAQRDARADRGTTPCRATRPRNGPRSTQDKGDPAARNWLALAPREDRNVLLGCSGDDRQPARRRGRHDRRLNTDPEMAQRRNAVPVEQPELRGERVAPGRQGPVRDLETRPRSEYSTGATGAHRRRLSFEVASN